jgi:hypothetical protein
LLKESEERLKNVLDGSQMGSWDWNIETGEVVRNDQWAAMLGYTLEDIEISVKQWTDLIKWIRRNPMYADLAEIRKAATQSADLTRQLLAFARKQTISPKVMDLNETVEGMLKMLRRRRDHARNERPGPGTKPAAPPPRHQEPLHVRIYGRCHRPPWRAGAEHQLHPETVFAKGSGCQSQRGFT